MQLLQLNLKRWTRGCDRDTDRSDDVVSFKRLSGSGFFYPFITYLFVKAYSNFLPFIWTCIVCLCVCVFYSVLQGLAEFWCVSMFVSSLKCAHEQDHNTKKNFSSAAHGIFWMPKYSQIEIVRVFSPFLISFHLCYHRRNKLKWF